MCASNPVSRTHLLNSIYSLLEELNTVPLVSSTQPPSLSPLHTQISPFYPLARSTLETNFSHTSQTQQPNLSVTISTPTSIMEPLSTTTTTTTTTTIASTPTFVSPSLFTPTPSFRHSTRSPTSPLPLPSSSSSSNNQCPENNSTIPTRVLVAEDNELNQRVVHRQFDMLGVEIDMVSNGYEALKAYENKGPYNAIFLDCQMPVMDGYESSRQIRELERSQINNTFTASSPEEEEPTKRGVKRKVPVPIVALTASTMPNEKRRCMESGMSNFLSKPLKISELKACLVEVGVLPSNQNV